MSDFKKPFPQQKTKSKSLFFRHHKKCAELKKTIKYNENKLKVIEEEKKLKVSELKSKIKKIKELQASNKKSESTTYSPIKFKFVLLCSNPQFATYKIVDRNTGLDVIHKEKPILKAVLLKK